MLVALNKVVLDTGDNPQLAEEAGTLGSPEPGGVGVGDVTGDGEVVVALSPYWNISGLLNPRLSISTSGVPGRL